jgi:hypothetical protein
MPPPDPIQKSEHDPSEYFSRLFKDAWAALPAAIYFWGYWPLKEYSRRVLRIGALLVLLISFLLLAFEIVMEISGQHQITTWLHSIKTPRLLILSQTGFVLATLIVVGHHLKEIRHKRSEYVLAKTLWSMLEIRGTHSREQFIEIALKCVNEAFSEFGAIGVCLWYPHDDGLQVPSNCVFPADAPVMVRFIPFNEGVTGRVFEDRLIRYTPRFAFPINGGPLSRFCWSLPHALAFETRRRGDELPDVVKPKLSIDAVKIDPGWWKRPVRSFVAVPLKFQNDLCLGVMTIHFGKTDPLCREELKTAASLAMLIAEELSRAQTATDRASAQG